MHANFHNLRQIFYMSFLACITAVAPIRAEASHRSEMVSQLLFGEIAQLLEVSGEFYRVKCLYDSYEGWCQRTQLIELTDEQSLTHNKDLAGEYINLIEMNGTKMLIPFGASLGLLDNNQGTFGHLNFNYRGTVSKPNKILFTNDYIRHIALVYLNTPYLWGGRSVFGIDCSGFAQQVYRFFNKHLPRDASQQALQGEVVGFLQEAICGDLAFFDNEDGHITHVGILLDPQTIIHSSGRVKIDKIDNQGIFTTDKGERTHNLRIIKRYV